MVIKTTVLKHGLPGIWMSWGFNQVEFYKKIKEE
jgi:hypothetical protein